MQCSEASRGREGETVESWRIGIVGFGQLGRAVHDRISDSEGRFTTAFAHNRSIQALSGLDQSVKLEVLSGFPDRGADLIVELSHPSITRDFGKLFLSECNYMPLSTTALVDDSLRRDLLETADRCGTRLFLPAGALVGGNALAMRSDWKEVTITFKKHPTGIDFSESGIDAAEITAPTTVYDGPVRGIAALFPRNVNTMVTCALVSTGLDNCRGVLVADPGIDYGEAVVDAVSWDGGLLRTVKRQQLDGVSGTEMADTVWHSIMNSFGTCGALEVVH